MHFIYKVLFTVDFLVSTNSAKLAKTFRSDLILTLIYKHHPYSCEKHHLFLSLGTVAGTVAQNV